MYNQSQSTSACLKKDMELIAREEGELTQRLAKELVKLAHEGIGFYLPIVVVDHVADTENNISFVKSRIKKCTKEGIENGDCLNLFKIRRVPVNATVDGNLITRTEVMIILQAEFCDAHQAIYRTLNQTVATRLRIGVYVFDHDECQYPDRTMCGEAIDTKLFANNSSVNDSVLNPFFIDVKEDRMRTEYRTHISKAQGGYPVARILGTTDIPRYRKMKKPSKPSTRDEPSGLSLGERFQSKPPQSQRNSRSRTRAFPSATSINVYDQTMCFNEQVKMYRSVLVSSPPSLSILDKRLVIDDEFYQPKSSVFKRLGPSTANNQVQSSNSHKRSNFEPIKPAKRLSVDLSDGIFLDSRARNPSSIRITHAPLNDSTTSKSVQVLPPPRSLNEMTNKLLPSQATSRNTQGVKSMSTSENIHHRTVHNSRDSRPSTRVQTTDAPVMLPSMHQPLPFKLVPVLPPNKNKVVNVNSSAQSEINKANKQVVVSTAPTQSVINLSSNRNPVLLAPTEGIQVQDEAMMLEDEAIVSIIMGSAPTIVENNEPEIINALALSTRDELSDLSLGEREQATAELRETVTENLPNAFGKAVSTHVEVTPARIIESLPTKSNNIEESKWPCSNEVVINSQLYVYSEPSSTMTINNQGPTLLRVEQSIER